MAGEYKQTRAIRLHAPGGPDGMHWEMADIPKPGKGEILLRHTAIGLNYIDTYHRTGLYPLAGYPAVLGLEASGVVEASGESCELKPGERVAYGGGPIGAYAEYRVIPERFVIRLPEDIDDRIAASVMVKGMTAYYLLRKTYPLKPGETILAHAAAGGVGLILCQWASHLGATVIGTVGSEEKAALAARHGCHHPVIYTKESFMEKVRALTSGKGVPVVYDSVGKTTFMDSLDCLRPFGLMVSYGQASGAIPPLDIGLLARKGSLFLTRPSLMHHIEDRPSYVQGCQELFELIRQGVIKVTIGQTFPLEDAAQAHRDLEARKTSGSTLLIP